MNGTWGHLYSILKNFHMFLLSREVISIFSVLMLVGLQLEISPNIFIFGTKRKHEHIKHFEINNYTYHFYLCIVWFINHI